MADADSSPVYSRQLSGETARRPAVPAKTVKAQVRAAGRWKSGQSGNPTGRPRGSQNQVQSRLRGLLLAGAEGVVQEVVRAAKAGDMVAAKLVLDRVVPRRLCALSIEGTSMDLMTLANADRALGAIIMAALDGRISATDAVSLSQLVETLQRRIEIADHERRLSEIEQRLWESK